MDSCGWLGFAAFDDETGIVARSENFDTSIVSTQGQPSLRDDQTQDLFGLVNAPYTFGEVLEELQPFKADDRFRISPVERIEQRDKRREQRHRGGVVGHQDAGSKPERDIGKTGHRANHDQLSQIGHRIMPADRQRHTDQTERVSAQYSERRRDPCNGTVYVSLARQELEDADRQRALRNEHARVERELRRTLSLLYRQHAHFGDEARDDNRERARDE